MPNEIMEQKKVKIEWNAYYKVKEGNQQELILQGKRRKSARTNHDILFWLVKIYEPIMKREREREREKEKEKENAD
jgi:hypothetical protein